MKISVIVACVCLLLSQAVLAHEVVLTDQKGTALLKIRFPQAWTASAARDGLELISPDSRTRIHCMEFPSYNKLEEGVVFLQTARDSVFQSYENVSDETIEFEGVPARLVQLQGVSRGFPTRLEALIFRNSDGKIFLVMLQQDMGYESNLRPLRELVTLP